MALNWLKQYLAETKEFKTHVRFWTYVLSKEDDVVSSFMAKHPLTAKVILSYYKVHEHYCDNIKYPVNEWLYDVRYKWFNGPVKVIVPTLKRMDWHDTDEIMFFAMFQLLVDFVELEIPIEAKNVGFIPARHCVNGRRYPAVAIAFLSQFYNEPERAEIIFLYKWWINVQSTHDADGNRSRIVSDAIYAKLAVGLDRVKVSAQSSGFRRDIDDAMLRRLIAVRHKLWT